METWKHHRIPTADELFCLMLNAEDTVDTEETLTTVETSPNETIEPVCFNRCFIFRRLS